MPKKIGRLCTDNFSNFSNIASNYIWLYLKDAVFQKQKQDYDMASLDCPMHN